MKEWHKIEWLDRQSLGKPLGISKPIIWLKVYCTNKYMAHFSNCTIEQLYNSKMKSE